MGRRRRLEDLRPGIAEYAFFSEQHRARLAFVCRPVLVDLVEEQTLNRAAGYVSRAIGACDVETRAVVELHVELVEFLGEMACDRLTLAEHGLQTRHGERLREIQRVKYQQAWARVLVDSIAQPNDLAGGFSHLCRAHEGDLAYAWLRDRINGLLKVGRIGDGERSWTVRVCQVYGSLSPLGRRQLLRRLNRVQTGLPYSVSL